MDERLIRLREKAKEDGEPILRDLSLELLLKEVKKRKTKSILEIGTNVGLSGIAMLLESDARITTIEIDEDKAKIARQNYKDFNLEKRAKIIIGDAGAVIPLLSGEYDLIFLDGPKGHYAEYFENLLPLLKVGGIVFADDILFHGFIRGNAPRKHITIKHRMEKYLQDIYAEGLKTEIIEVDDGISITEKLK